MATKGEAGPISSKAREDYARELYHACTKDARGAKGLSSKGATWVAILGHVLRSFAATTAKGSVCIDAILAGMGSNRIECTPGTPGTRLNARHVMRLVGHGASRAISSAPPGSLKRRAMEALDTDQKRRVRRRISFGCAVPFTAVPELLVKGFEEMERLFLKGDQSILEHYQVVRNCLEGCIGEPICDLMLMLVMTMASCSVTPTVAVGQRAFSAGPRKSPALFAVNLVTRMLWFFRPGHFPWTADHGSVLSVPEMTKKMEHKGVNSRLICVLGWVRVISGKRDSPRNSQLRLEDESVHLTRLKSLLKLQRDPVGFIQEVFQDNDSVWVDRCAEIIRDNEVE